MAYHQEDNLQHLALFSEYGRIALNNKVVGENGEEEEVVVPEHAKDEKPFQSICFLVSWQLVVVMTDRQMLHEVKGRREGQ